MNALTHVAILAAGRYHGVRIEPGEAETARSLHRFMLRLRACEEVLAREYHPADEMRCPVHFCIGQEAVPAALSALLTRDDYLFSHHRSHGYYLAKGAPMPAMFAELYGKETGANGGRAGSQDISCPSVNFHSGAILAGATAIAMGAALGFHLRGESRVAVAGFGESATDQGIFWETVSYAALRQLPIVFVCENNNYSVFSPQLKRQAQDNISERVATFGLKSVPLFGNDAPLVYRTLKSAIADARAGSGPSFIEAYTYRWSGHYGPASDDLVGYRSEEELKAWKDNCPIALLEEAMVAKGLLSEAYKAALLEEIDAEIAESFHFAKSSPFPKAEEWEAMNYASSSPVADALLADVDVEAFDADQAMVQAKGY
jgi:TPP-dependent pyruvate/acetoin dehydrogenase alpha subunit